MEHFSSSAVCYVYVLIKAPAEKEHLELFVVTHSPLILAYLTDQVWNHI